MNPLFSPRSLAPLKPIAIAAAVLATTAAAANADILHYQAQLRGAAETPPNPSKARGEVTAVLDTDRHAFEYTVTYKDLSGPVTVAGFKQPTSPPDDPIVTAPTDPKTGVIHAVVTLTKGQVQDLNAGRWIFDISTGASPAGEIRGKVQRTSVY
ncbi:MAG TPA: CHRD domain-containing protein [Caulobacteraceae bacterium]|nr:CHRD domain-containing protein [Caulobacteraceae bacterium]